MILHRRRYEDWTLPKGKLQDRESFQQAAVREVKEETGCICEVGEYVGAIDYEANGLPKAVLFWLMRLVEQYDIEDREEVAEAIWLPAQAAVRRLSYRGEKQMVSSVMLSEGRRMNLPKFRVLFQRRAFARLHRGLEIAQVELEFLHTRSKNPDKKWHGMAEQYLQRVKQYLDSRDLEGGWACLHAAHRAQLFGLEPAELALRAAMLREEAKKLIDSPWRGKAIEYLVSVPPAKLTADRVSEAAALRDEYFANQYHKIWLTADQLLVLLGLCALASVGLLFLLVGKPMPSELRWDRQMVAAILLFGLLGAGFSAAQSLTAASSGLKIPERMANAYVTVTRTLFGSIAGLASYAFLSSQLFSINIGNGSNKAALALAVAFAFGYAGEKLVARVAGALPDGKAKS